jgi:hypothetical protein
MNLSYNGDIPATPNNPSNDQPKMKINTNSIANWAKIDHFGFNDNNGGYHTIIHQNAGVSPAPIISRSGVGAVLNNFPATIANFNQFFTAQYTADAAGAPTDTQLFSKTGNGGVNQLTGSLTSSEGYVWLGGVMMQWGTANFTGGPSFGQQSGQVMFQDAANRPGCPPFPNNCFVVVPALHSQGGNTSNSQTISYFSISKNSFRWNYTGSSAYDRMNWIAIGN